MAFFSTESPRHGEYKMKCMGNIREQFLILLSDKKKKNHFTVLKAIENLTRKRKGKILNSKLYHHSNMWRKANWKIPTTLLNLTFTLRMMKIDPSVSLSLTFFFF